MNTLAFLCTNSEGWDPFCNGTQFGVLVLIGLVAGTLATYAFVAKRQRTHPLLGVVIWLVATVLSLMVSVAIGFNI